MNQCSWELCESYARRIPIQRITLPEMIKQEIRCVCHKVRGACLAMTTASRACHCPHWRACSHNDYCLDQP